MFALLLAAVTAITVVSGAPIQSSDCKRYNVDKLEDYATYHFRYVALDCRTQHNTTFFDDCCRPLRQGQNLTEIRPAQCIPNDTQIASASSHIASATAALPTPSASGTGYDSYAGQANSTEGQKHDDGAAAAYSSDGASWSAPSQQATPTPDASSAPSSSPSPSPSPSPAVNAEQAAAQYQQPPQGISSSEDATTSSSSSQQPPSPTSSSEQPKETSTGDNNQGNSGSSDNQSGVNQGGEATFYAQTDGGLTGACGDVHSDSDLVVALSTKGQWYPNTGEKSPYCGRQVQIWPAGSFAGQGNVVTATVADACPTCSNGNSIDLSYGTWDAMGISRDVGVVPIDWKFI
ncbi:hypothetical protein CC85DRAFT_261304 [Cutaneotrichosporon oleaginosum]|uniref:RlpA-like protein double-psi beta-barrel domain-containing protein n=1 Tax=Cutaneotrichosporon oleaginosum TaxID=879819 RepID=A0A0J0XL71_9TREE|nr:uncharacterized protein CC85DRAFT_261304 [Cutaneotrichosporon oleaginosum]KLT41825.1 hypothetical protein CC85DRAFT_261304 [Cutaneotrichosporon oleaginosum]TXT14746.1 hypothetical protein COLE_00939 [Cutaneotrichosporon oleaginosum]